MHINSSDIIHFLCALFGGGGFGVIAIKALMQKEAEKAVKPTLDEITKELKRIHENYVTCKFCDATRETMQSSLFEINKKLDLLIDHAITK